MAGEYNIRRRETIRGNVDPYILEYKGIAPAVLQAANALEERRTKGAEIKSALTAAVNQLPLDHSEDTYKKEFIDRYSDLIKQDPFDVAKIQEYATQAANDPELLAKHRTHLEHEAFVKDVEDYRKAGKISSTTAERLLKDPSNQYKFTPTIKDGVITGSEKWTAGKMPVQHVDRNAILATARQFIAPLKGKKHTARSSSVTNADGTGKGGGSDYSDQWETVTEEMIDDVFEGVFNAMPEARESLLQDYEDDLYNEQKYSDLLKNATTDAEKTKWKDALDSTRERLYDNGVLRSQRSYNAYSMGMIKPHMAYDYHFIDDSRHSTVDNQASGSGAGGSGGALSAALGDDLFGIIKDYLPGGAVYSHNIEMQNKQVDAALQNQHDAMIRLAELAGNNSYTDSDGRRYNKGMSGGIGGYMKRLTSAMRDSKR